jgi:hypothetical protein
VTSWVTDCLTRQEREYKKPMNPDDIHSMQESHTCARCENLVVEIEFKNGDKLENGCHCEVGGEA